jgi:formyl-CoA transferase
VINTYLTAEDEWVTVTSATPRSVLNVVNLLGLLAEEFATREAQLARRGELDDRLRDWIKQRKTEECLALMHDNEVVSSRIYTVKDILADRSYRERGDVISIEDPDLATVRMQGVVPNLTEHGGSV